MDFETVNHLLSYDKDTGVLRWKAQGSGGVKAGDALRSKDRDGYLYTTIKRRFCRAHRLAWLLTHGSMPVGQIDHINGIRDDNRLVNLRLASPGENSRNRARQRTSSAPYKGITQIPQTGRWQAQIKMQGRTIYLGQHDTAEAAHLAYCDASKRLHGAFSNTGTVE